MGLFLRLPQSVLAKFHTCALASDFSSGGWQLSGMSIESTGCDVDRSKGSCPGPVKSEVTTLLMMSRL